MTIMTSDETGYVQGGQQLISISNEEASIIFNSLRLGMHEFDKVLGCDEKKASYRKLAELFRPLFF